MDACWCSDSVEGTLSPPAFTRVTGPGQVVPTPPRHGELLDACLPPTHSGEACTYACPGDVLGAMECTDGEFAPSLMCESRRAALRSVGRERHRL